MVSDTHHSATRTATTFALASATLMIAHQVAGKATRDAIFLSHYEVTDLPKIVITAAVLSMIAVISAVCCQMDPEKATRALSEALQTGLSGEGDD